MSAAQIGASLLADVEEISLDQLLANLRNDLGHGLIPKVGFYEIDQLLQHFLTPPPLSGTHATALFTSSDEEVNENDHQRSYHSGAEQPDMRLASKPGPILIEVLNTPNGTECIDLCYLLTATSILQESPGEEGNCVVWLDTDIRFSASRLFQICLKQLTNTRPNITQTERMNEAKQAIKHVHVFSVQSSKQLLSTLDLLPYYLLGMNCPPTGTESTPILPKHHSFHRQLSMIVLDSATAFHWTDRFDAEIARLEAQTTVTGNRSSSTETTTSVVLKKLKEIQETFSCAVVYTTDHTMTKIPTLTHAAQHQPISHVSSISAQQQQQQQQSANTTNPQHQQQLPSIQAPPETPTTHIQSPWTSHATLSLMLTPLYSTVPQFATTHMTLQDCLRDRQTRFEAVCLRRTRVSVNEDWAETVFKCGEGNNKCNAMERERRGDSRITKDDRTAEDIRRNGFIIRCLRDGVDVEH